MVHTYIMAVAEIDPRTITAPVTLRARWHVGSFHTGESLSGGVDHTFIPRETTGVEGVRVIDVTDDRGKWQGVYLLVTTKSGHVDATFARAANKIRKRDVVILCERAAAFAGKTYNPAGEARNSVLIDRKRGRI